MLRQEATTSQLYLSQHNSRCNRSEENRIPRHASFSPLQTCSRTQTIESIQTKDSNASIYVSLQFQSSIFPETWTCKSLTFSRFSSTSFFFLQIFFFLLLHYFLQQIKIHSSLSKTINVHNHLLLLLLMYWCIDV